MSQKVIIFLLSTSLFLTSCSQKPKQSVSFPPPPPSPPSQQIFQPQAQPTSQPTPKPPQSQPASQSTPQSIAPLFFPPIDLEQILRQKYLLLEQKIENLAKSSAKKYIIAQNCGLTGNELSSSIKQYVICLKDWQPTHKNLMEANNGSAAEQIYQNYLKLEIGPLEVALYSIVPKEKLTLTEKQKRLEDIAIKYLEESGRLGLDTPINYLSSELKIAYTNWVGIREACLEQILERASQKQKIYPSFVELLTDNLTEQEYEGFMQQLVPAAEEIKQAFLKSRTGLKGNFLYFAKKEIKSTAKFTSQFYLDTIQRYYDN